MAMQTKALSRNRSKSNANRTKQRKRDKPAPDFLYGLDGYDRLFFIPPGTARKLAVIHRAVAKCKTWVEFKKRVPEDVFQEAWELAEPESEADNLEIPAYYDGDWPEHPAQLMFEWLPSEILSEFGKCSDSMLSGDVLELDPSKVKEIVSALKRLGYRCRKNDDLICGACGF